MLVVGAGQAGLGVAHRLRDHAELRVLVVDALAIGESWRERWESLQPFTPRRSSALPGMRFPAGPTRSPSRLEMASYLREYVARFDLPVRTGVQVRRLTRDGQGFCVETSHGVVRARQVVLASGPFRQPFVPVAAASLDPAVTQLHSSQYQTPVDVPPGKVLVVGGGNSAAQLALELADTHEVTVASPGPPWFLPEDILGVSMYWWTLYTGVLNARADAWVSRHIRRRGDAIVGTQVRALVRQGRVRLLPHRVVAARDREVELADGTLLPVATVLWCTGFRPDTGWIDVDGALDPTGAPVHDEERRRCRGCTGWACRGRRA